MSVMRGIVSLSGNVVAIFRNFDFATLSNDATTYTATCTGRCQKGMDATVVEAVCNN